MNENHALDAANDVINLIMDKIGQKILDEYINSKYLSHSSIEIKNKCESLATVSIFIFIII